MAGSKSSKAPAFQFYPKDYLSDAKTRAMTFKQRGMYWDLVSHCWLEGGLPEDPVEIARILGITTPARFKQSDWPVISRCFRRIEGKGHQHPRLEIERRKQRQHKAERSEAGKLGAFKRWQGDGKIMAQPSKSYDRRIAKDSSSSSSASASSDSSHKERTHAKVAHDGSRLKIWHWQHEDLGKRLGAKISDFDLLGWYSRLETELAETGEAFADPWKWLQERLYRDANLPLPNLMARRTVVAEVEDVRSWCQHPNGCPNREYHENMLRMEARNKANV